jgi:two-component system OmpR family sensor kinase/two-component system phosphate regulon sensor histidine kinase PhoR
VALVGISSVTSLIIGLVLYYFAQDRLVTAENNLLEERSRTANAGAQDFLDGLRNPEDRTLPPAESYAEGSSSRSPTRRPRGALREPRGRAPGSPRQPREPPQPAQGLQATGVRRERDQKTAGSTRGEGRLVWSEGRSGYVALWPLTGSDGEVKGVLVYDVPRDELQETLAYLATTVSAAILTSILLAGAASLLLTRQVRVPSPRPVTQL